MDTTALAFKIGGDEADFILVYDIDDHQDGWFSAAVEVRAGAFRAIYGADFNSWAFADFVHELEAMYSALSGTATFTSYEGQLELTLKCNERGSILLDGQAMDVAGTGHRLQFRLELNQSHLPPVIASLRAMLERTPARDAV